MIRAETLAALVQQHRNHRGKGAACTILTVKLNDPNGYGRVVRNAEGFVRPHRRAKRRFRPKNVNQRK
jgi:bifunctional UDP-N-acetylglucosamine pyrophosphorylase/glucosamine-1-phosphate N-acetyltransferase